MNSTTMKHYRITLNRKLTQTTQRTLLLLTPFTVILLFQLKSYADDHTEVYNACVNMIPAGTKGYELEYALEDCKTKQEIYDKQTKKKLETLKDSWKISNFKKSCNDWSKIWSKEYPVSGIVESSTELGAYSPNGCKSSRLYLVCESGNCFVSFNSRPHGFFPGKINKASIDGKVWSWRGDPSTTLGHQMWKAIKDKSSVGLELVLWPYTDIRPFKYSIAIPKGLKTRVYQASLEKPN